MVWIAVSAGPRQPQNGSTSGSGTCRIFSPCLMHQAVELAIQLALMLFGVLITWYSVGWSPRTMISRRRHCLFRWPGSYVPMVLAGAVTAVQGAREVKETVHRLRAPAAAQSLSDQADTR